MPDRSVSIGRASAAIGRVLQQHGITKVFGNPGTFELPIYDEFDDLGIDLVLTLQEVVTGAAASGYAAYTRRPAVALMHTIAGLGNGSGSLYGAAAMELPVVVLVGEPDSRSELDAPNLVGDAAAMASSYAKHVIRLRSADQAGVAVAMALAIAARPRRGPVVITYPMDLVLREGEFECPLPSAISPEPVASDLERLLSPVLEARAPLLIVGAEVPWSGAVPEAVRLAERLDIPVMSEAMNQYTDFPSRHPLYRGVLPAIPAVAAKVLAKYDVVLVIGASVFRPLLHGEGHPLPPSTRIYHLDDRVSVPGVRWSIEMGSVGGIRESLHRLNELVPERASAVPRDGRVAADVPKKVSRDHVGVDAAFAAISAEFGNQFIVVDEACSCSWQVRSRFERTSEDYFACTIGNLGHGPGYAVGISEAAADRPVLAIVGDGSIMYASQALWTAANRRSKVVFLVLNNGGYESLRSGYRSFDSKAAARNEFPGTELEAPALDYVALALAHGVPGSVADAPKDLVVGLGECLERAGPSLIDYRLP